jgi:hypothetical protein
MINDIYLVPMGCHLAAMVSKYVQKWERDRQLYTKGETIHKTTQKRRIHKTETTQNNKINIKSILKNIKGKPVNGET